MSEHTAHATTTDNTIGADPGIYIVSDDGRIAGDITSALPRWDEAAVDTALATAGWRVLGSWRREAGQWTARVERTKTPSRALGVLGDVIGWND